MTFHPAHRRGAAAVLLAAGMAAAVSGCQNDGTAPTDALRFGQLGEATIELETPVLGDSTFDGTLRQSIQWHSSGEWRIQESLSYQGKLGDANESVSVGDLTNSAGAYQSWIVEVNDDPAEKIVGYADEDWNPVCEPYETRVTVTIHDEARGETKDWKRCAQGSLAQLDPFAAGGYRATSRVIQSVVLVRDWTVGRSFRPVYAGSRPFATLERGEDLPGGLSAGAIRDPTAWSTFWSALHPDSTTPPPSVDFSRQVVLVGVGKPWDEAGDSIEVRRVLPVEFGTKVEVVERRPATFCSPAKRPLHRPYHVVVTPEVPAPVQFNQVSLEKVPCQ